jgi:uncharacterized LabA/DUF88 family protein
MNEPTVKRTIAYIDGQNLFDSAKEAFGYPFPNYDITKLVTEVCRVQGWKNDAIYFYTGVPDASFDPKRHGFWNAKLAAMGTRGIQTFSRPLRYSNQLVALPNGGIASTSVGREKGIDIRLALDIVRDALDNAFDVALVFSQDQDLSEVAQELRSIGKRDSRWIKMASAFPTSPTIRNRRGINGTDWVTFDRATYDACIDPTDYRPRP